MTANQLQKFLDNHGLSQRGAARLIGISERSMRRYVAGDLPVPQVVEYALRYLAIKIDEEGMNKLMDAARQFGRQP